MQVLVGGMPAEHGLFRALALPRDPRRTLQLIERNAQGDHDQPRQHKAHASECIGAAVKYLRHECFPLVLLALLVMWRRTLIETSEHTPYVLACKLVTSIRKGYEPVETW